MHDTYVWQTVPWPPSHAIVAVRFAIFFVTNDIIIFKSAVRYVFGCVNSNWSVLHTSRARESSFLWQCTHDTSDMCTLSFTPRATYFFWRNGNIFFLLEFWRIICFLRIIFLTNCTDEFCECTLFSLFLYVAKISFETKNVLIISLFIYFVVTSLFIFQRLFRFSLI